MTRSLLAAALVTLTLGCAGFNDGTVASARFQCTSDEQCGEGEVCFPDGCGDPGHGIVVEVTPDNAGGQLAQEFPVAELKAVQDIHAEAPPAVQGTIQQSSEKGNLPWTSEVTLVAQGESVLIPGRTRVVQYSITPENGAYEVPIASGLYTIVFNTKNSLYPPVVVQSDEVRPGETITVDVTYPALTELVQVEGYLLKNDEPATAVDNAEMEVQAFDPLTGQQLSQRVDASSGVPTVSTGYFRIWVHPTDGMETLRIVASPKHPNALVPTQTFDVPFAQTVGDLVMGDFGSEVTVSGKVVSTNGQPLPAAQVRVSGTVTGGGKFKSASVTTDESGAFTLKTLPSGTGFLELVVTPSPKSDSGQARIPVEVPRTGGELAGPFVAPDKIQVVGQLARPDGAIAAGVQVRAQPIFEHDGNPLPSGTTTTTSDEAGSFSLRLDPAVYRLDFVPPDNLPRVSRFVTVDAMTGSTGQGFAPIVLPQFTLSRGRTVTGVVRSIPNRLAIGGEPVPAPRASVSFYRVVQFGERRSHILLGEGLADADGQYKLTLPTR